MWPLTVSIDGGRCLLIRWTFKFGYIVKYPFLISWRIFWLTGLNSLVCNHCTISGLFLSSIRLFSYQSVGVGLGCGVVYRCTCHISDTSFRVLSRNMFPFFSTVIYVAVDIGIHPSSYIFSMKIIAPGWRWGNICATLALVDNNGLIFRSTLWVSWNRLLFRRSTWVPLVVLNFFT